MRVDGKTTNAGWRKVKAPAKDWVCPVDGGHTLRHYWVSCPDHGTKRPKED